MNDKTHSVSTLLVRRVARHRFRGFGVSAIRCNNIPFPIKGGSPALGGKVHPDDLKKRWNSHQLLTEGIPAGSKKIAPSEAKPSYGRNERCGRWEQHAGV